MLVTSDILILQALEERNDHLQKWRQSQS